MSDTREGCVFFYSSENAVALPKQPEKVVRDGTARGTPDVAARAPGPSIRTVRGRAARVGCFHAETHAAEVRVRLSNPHPRRPVVAT